MLRFVCKSKIAGVTITKKELHYSGSIGIDKNILDACNLYPNEIVQVLNQNNGNRFETYIIEEKAGSGIIGLYGPAARLGEVGDILFILSQGILQENEMQEHKIKVINLDEQNVVLKAQIKMGVKLVKNTKNYTIVTFPANILRQRTKQIPGVDEEILSILSAMINTMYENNGIGLAAPQVGLGLNMAVVDAGEGVYQMINPVIIDRKGTNVMEEGCLSLPSVIVSIKRAESITIKYTDELGREVSKDLSGITAKAMQHEMDHLAGKLIIDYLPWFKRIFRRKNIEN